MPNDSQTTYFLDLSDGNTTKRIKSVKAGSSIKVLLRLVEGIGEQRITAIGNRSKDGKDFDIFLTEGQTSAEFGLRWGEVLDLISDEEESAKLKPR